MLKRLALAAIVTMPVLAPPAFAAAEIKSQPACAPLNGKDYCLQFNGGQSIPILRGFIFHAPSKGAATLTFHGTLFCKNSSATPQSVAFYSQIVTVPALIADGRQSGGLRHEAILLGGPYSTTFNLASTRVFAISAAGPQSYYFKLKKIESFVGFCNVHNAAFSVTFVP